jgi:acyl carrier protein
MTREELVDQLVRKMGADPAKLGDDTPLFSSGMLDSFRMIDLMSFVESRGGFRMDPLDVTLENLDTVGRILAYVARRKR